VDVEQNNDGTEDMFDVPTFLRRKSE